MKTSSILKFGRASVALLSAGSVLGATLLFDELPNQPVDGLSFAGVTFNFEVLGSSSLDAQYNVDLGFGSTVQTTDPVLEGDAMGLLTLTFAAPTTTLSFGVLLLGMADYVPGAVVDLYAGAVLVDSVSLNTLADAAEPISEAFFNWSNALTPIDMAVVDFEDGAGRFAVDNLSFIPEPSPVIGAMALAGFAFAAHLRRRRA